MNFRYTYIGILNLDFYNKCGALLLIVILGVLIIMSLVLFFFTKDRYVSLSDLVYWKFTAPMVYFDIYQKQQYWINLGRLDFYWKSKKLKFMQHEDESLEIGWTLLPVFILLLLLVPSLHLLFLMDNTKLPVGEEFRTWMVTGHQWYWEYKTINKSIVFEDYAFSPYDDDFGFKLLGVNFYEDALLMLLLESGCADIDELEELRAYCPWLKVFTEA